MSDELDSVEDLDSWRLEVARLRARVRELERLVARYGLAKGPGLAEPQPAPENRSQARPGVLAGWRELDD